MKTCREFFQGGLSFHKIVLYVLRRIETTNGTLQYFREEILDLSDSTLQYYMATTPLIIILFLYLVHKSIQYVIMITMKCLIIYCNNYHIKIIIIHYNKILLGTSIVSILFTVKC